MLMSEWKTTVKWFFMCRLRVILKKVSNRKISDSDALAQFLRPHTVHYLNDTRNQNHLTHTEKEKKRRDARPNQANHNVGKIVLDPVDELFIRHGQHNTKVKL